jgi:capsid protein
MHCFDAERPGQTRGKPLLSPILTKLKMLDRYENTELQAALINTIFTLVVKSEYPHADVAQAMGVMYDDKGQPVSPMSQIMSAKSSYYDDGNSI